MALTKTPTGIEWKGLLKTVSIPINGEFECIYGPKDKCIYVMQRDPNNQTIITVYDTKGFEKDRRVYSHYFNSFFELSGNIYMSYYSWSEQVYLQGRFMGNAGITAVEPFTPPE